MYTYSVNNYSNNIIIEHTHITYSYSSATSYSCLYAIGLSSAKSMCWCRVSCRKYNVTSSQSSLSVATISSALYHVTDYNATHSPWTNLLLVTLETAVGSYQDNGRLVNKRYFARH